MIAFGIILADYSSLHILADNNFIDSDYSRLQGWHFKAYFYNLNSRQD
jgi:hypothetical protein